MQNNYDWTASDEELLNERTQNDNFDSFLNKDRTFYLDQNIETKDILTSTECEIKKEDTKENCFDQNQMNIDEKDLTRINKIYEYFENDRIEDEKILKYLREFEDKLNSI